MSVLSCNEMKYFEHCCMMFIRKLSGTDFVCQTSAARLNKFMKATLLYFYTWLIMLRLKQQIILTILMIVAKTKQQKKSPSAGSMLQWHSSLSSVTRKRYVNLWWRCSSVLAGNQRQTVLCSCNWTGRLVHNCFETFHNAESWLY